jgi:hypothetical protein
LALNKHMTRDRRVYESKLRSGILETCFVVQNSDVIFAITVLDTYTAEYL